MTALWIDADDPTREDVRVLLDRHLAHSHEHSPPADVHALPADRLLDPTITFFSARGVNGELLGVGALRELDAYHGEIKSMHTAAEHRGRGIARAILSHLLTTARTRGYKRVSLETGSMSAYIPARSLYESVGFTRCAPFGDYWESANSVCMTILLE